MDTTQLKNEALLVNDLLTKYIELHNGYLKSATTFSSLFRRVDFGALADEIYLLFEMFRDEQSKVSELQEQKGSENEEHFAKALFLYTEALTETVHLLYVMTRALQEKAKGNKLSFQEHMTNDKKYKESIEVYQQYGEELNNLYRRL